jgi:hypothetical protein
MSSLPAFKSALPISRKTTQRLTTIPEDAPSAITYDLFCRLLRGEHAIHYWLLYEGAASIRIKPSLSIEFLYLLFAWRALLQYSVRLRGGKQQALVNRMRPALPILKDCIY